MSTLRTAAGPRLFFNSTDVARMRRLWVEDARFKELRDSLESFDRVAERDFLATKLNVRDHRVDIRRVCDVAQDMAFLFLMTNDRDAADLAVESVRALMKFDDWDFFIDGGRIVGVQAAPRAVVAVAGAVDWLGDLISAEERAEWLRLMGERGCEACFTGLHTIRWPRQAQGWSFNPRSSMFQERTAFPNDNARRPEITQVTNLRAVPAGALAVGVACLKLHNDGAAHMERWLEMALVSLRAFDDVYMPDGSYGEGVNYGNYTSEHISQAVITLRNAGLADLRDGINWPGNIRFMLNMAMPTATNPYEVINIGDSARHRDQVRFQHPDGRPESRSALAFWVAREFRDGTAQWFGENLAAAHNLWSLMFFDDTLVAVPPENKLQLWHSDLDWMVARTGYRAEDLTVSLRSGIGWNHEHADRNSIILKQHGEQLIVDPIRPPYEFTDPCWIMRTTLGHSAVLVDGAGHFYHNGVEGTNSTYAQARILATGEGPGHCYWVSDATQAYRLANINIRCVIRAVIVLPEISAVVVIDRVGKWHDASRFQARYFADNWDGLCTVTTNANGFMVRRPQAFVQARVFGRGPLQVAAGQLPMPEQRAVKHPFVGVESEAVMDTTIATTFAIAPTDGRPADLDVELTADELVIRGHGTVVARVADGNFGLRVTMA
jgi:hypothetical protein